ncbi:unnamed protein product [Withania somnifera]
MKKVRGFRLGRRTVRVFKLFIHRRRKGKMSYKSLESTNCATKTISKLCNFGKLLKDGVRSVNYAKTGSGYIRVGSELMDQNQIPKGHLVVYVGENEDDTCRVLTAEMVYGFNHSGGIQIPCRIYEFEKVRSRIATTGGSGGSCHGRRRRGCKYW